MITTSKNIWGFDPRSLGGCQLWFDAADSATVTLNGSRISTWRDKSGNGYSVIQPTSSIQPFYTSNLLNGLPGVQLTSANYLYQVGSSIPKFSSSTSTTVFIVAKNATTFGANGWSIFNTLWFFGSSAGTLRYHLSFGQDTTNAVTLFANGCLLYTSPSPRDRQKSRMPSSA